ncbi:MAG: tetratricopeptide repeat protein [Acidobacteria bacterium]|nr:tetratricopeptide repeat protein [Acidobacteriota bacterium]
MRKLFFRRFVLAPTAVAALTLLAQQPGTPTTGGGGTNTGGATSPGTGGSRGTNTNTNPGLVTTNPQQNIPRMPTTVFFTGKVMMEDGTPPTEPVTIEQVCNGTARPKAYTDSKGRFSYNLSNGSGPRGMPNNGGVLPDASNGGDPLGSMDDGFGGGSLAGGRMGGGMLMGLSGCEIRANLPGYRSSVIMLANRSSLDNPDVGTIILKTLGNREGSVFSATNAMAPKDAKKALEKGRELNKKKKTADARKEFDKAVELYPKYASAWYEIGLLEEAAKNPEGARKAYAQALAADPKYVIPYTRLFMMSVDEQKWEDVADTTARLIKLNPYDFPNAFYYNAVANFNLKRYDEAGKSAKSLYEQDEKRYSRAGYLLGLVMATKQDFSGASVQLKQYLDRNPQAQDRDLVTRQLAEIEKFAGRGAAAGSAASEKP